MTFKSRDVVRLEEHQRMVEMEMFVGRYLDETQLTYDEIYDLFVEAFPTEGDRFAELVEDWMA